MSDKLRILMVDDDRRMTKTLLDIFRVKGYLAEAAQSGAEALEKVTEGHFDCVLTDINMPEMSGVSLCRAIKEVKPELPVVLMTAHSADDLVKEGLKEGAVASLTKPLDITLLLSFFSILRKERCIVIIDDDPQFCRTLGDILRARGFAVTQSTQPSGLADKLKSEEQLLLLDMKLNSSSCLEVLKKIKEYYPHLPVILVTGYREEMTQAIEIALKVNVYTCLYKPFQIEDLLQLLTEIHHLELGRVLGQPASKIR